MKTFVLASFALVGIIWIVMTAIIPAMVTIQNALNVLP
jgi:hypothetical protein